MTVSLNCPTNTELRLMHLTQSFVQPMYDSVAFECLWLSFMCGQFQFKKVHIFQCVQLYDPNVTLRCQKSFMMQMVSPTYCDGHWTSCSWSISSGRETNNAGNLEKLLPLKPFMVIVNSSARMTLHVLGIKSQLSLFEGKCCRLIVWHPGIGRNSTMEHSPRMYSTSHVLKRCDSICFNCRAIAGGMTYGVARVRKNDYFPTES